MEATQVRPTYQNRRRWVATIAATLVAVVAALIGPDAWSSDHGGAVAGHRSGITGEVRVVVDFHLAWEARPEGRRA